MDCSDVCELVDSPLTEARRAKVQQSSERRSDDFYESLDFSNPLHYHKNCYLTYTSSSHIERYRKRTSQGGEDSPPPKRTGRSSSNLFDFKRNCLICGDICNVEKDKKHPERWERNKAFLCRTSDRGKGKISFKDVLLQVLFVYKFLF